MFFCDDDRGRFRCSLGKWFHEWIQLTFPFRDLFRRWPDLLQDLYEPLQMLSTAGNARTCRFMQKSGFKSSPFHLQALEFTQVTNDSVRHGLMFRSVGSLHSQFGLRQVTLHFFSVGFPQCGLQFIDSLGEQAGFCAKLIQLCQNFRFARIVITANGMQIVPSLLHVDVKGLGL